MKFKSVLMVIIAVVLLFTCSVTSYAIDESEYEEVYDFATSFLDEYFYAANLYSEYDFTQFADSPEFISFVEGKVSHWRMFMDRVGGAEFYSDYYVEYSLNKREIIDDCVKLTIGYSEYELYDGNETYSSYHSPCQVIVGKDEEGYVIKDWYTTDYGYDREIRGGGYLEIDDPDFWYDTDNTSVMTQSVDFYLKWSESHYEQMFGDISAPIEEEIDVSPPAFETNATLCSLDRTAMVNWALGNCTAYLPSSGNSSAATYVDFSTLGSNSWDCTNFISHALLAGGAVMYSPDNPTGVVTDDSYWFFVSGSVRSRTWSGVGDFFNFVTTNTTKGPTGRSIAYPDYTSSAGTLCSAGDIIQLYYSNTWKHSTIVTGFGSYSGYTVPTITGRSSPDASAIQNNEICWVTATKKGATNMRIIKLWGYLN